MNRREALRTLGAGAAAGALAGGAVIAAEASTHDPLLALVERTRSMLAAVDAIEDFTDDELNAVMQPVNVLYDEIAYRTPVATTTAGALAALRFAHDTMEHSCEIINRPLVGAALAYFEGRA